jgi:hypothetical protein
VAVAQAAVAAALFYTRFRRLLVNPNALIMTKEQVITSLQDLPNSFEPEQLIERIIALQKMEEGLNQVKPNG